MPGSFACFRFVGAALLVAASLARADDTPPIASAPIAATLDLSASGAHTPTIAGELSPSSLPSIGTASGTPAPSRALFFNELGEQVGFVGALKSWRETFRASGTAPRRDLWKEGQGALSLGDVRAPNIAGAGIQAGTAFSLTGKNGASFDIGTTARPAALDGFLQKFDATTTGTPQTAPTSRASETWIRARPVSDSQTQIEATLGRAALEQTGEGAPQGKSATFADLSARLALPAKWQLRGDWTSASLDGNTSRTRWNTAASGPLSHPWGVADVSLDWRTTGAGFSTLSGQNAMGESAGNAQITQKMATPLVSGTLSAATSTHSVLDPSTLGAGGELGRDFAGANADLKVKLAPNLALSATGAASQTQIALLAGEDARQRALVGTSGDVGFDWQLSKNVSIGAATGVSQTSDSSAPAPFVESRNSLQVKSALADGNLALALQLRDRDGTSEARWAHLAALRIEASKRLIGDWHLTSNANWIVDRGAASGDAHAVARQIGAGLSFARAASLDVRVRDGAALPFDATNDPLAAAFGSPSFATGSREIATRFNLGAAASGGNGLGMALEWARAGAIKAPNDTWKIGLTYR